MKHLHYLSTLLLFFPLLCSGQDELNDALLLKRYATYSNQTVTIGPKHHDNQAQFLLERDSICAVLIKHFPELARDTNMQLYPQHFRVLIANNPFLKGKTALSGLTMSSLPNTRPAQAIGNIIASAGGINVTNFADGLAQFMVERFKEELSTAFFEQFKQDLNDPKYKDLRLLFPQTAKLLNTIDKNIYQYNIYINSLREAFKNDLSNLYGNLENVMDQKVYQDYFTNHPELKTILDVSGYLIDQYAKGAHPGQVLADMQPGMLKFSDPSLQTNVQSALATLQLFSASLKSPAKDDYWLGADALPVPGDTVLTQLYFGLLYQNKALDRISFVDGRTQLKLRKVFDTIASLRDSLNAYVRYIRGFADQAEEVGDYIKELKAKSKKDIDYNDYYKLFNASLDLVQYSFGSMELPFVGTALPAALKASIRYESVRWLYVARSSADLYLDVRTRNYSSAVINTISIIDTVLNTNISLQKAELQTLVDAAGKIIGDSLKDQKKQRKDLADAVKRYTDAGIPVTVNKLKSDQRISSISNATLQQAVTVINQQQAIAQIDAKGKVRAALLKYGSFMAAVANAQSSDDVKAAIETTVLPAGSYSIKRETDFNISLNGFVGPYGGYEYLPALKKNPWATTLGFTAPVGVAFSWGNINNGQRRDTPVVRKRSNGKEIGGQSISLFVSLIDIGAVASYRLGNDSSKVSADIKLKNIVSPGAYIYWGLPKYPVSIGIGAQIGPQLRQITATNADIDENYYLRFGFNVVVDIPFYNIYSRN